MCEIVFHTIAFFRLPHLPPVFCVVSLSSVSISLLLPPSHLCGLWFVFGHHHFQSAIFTHHPPPPPASLQPSSVPRPSSLTSCFPLRSMWEFFWCWFRKVSILKGVYTSSAHTCCSVRRKSTSKARTSNVSLVRMCEIYMHVAVINWADSIVKRDDNNNTTISFWSLSSSLSNWASLLMR